MAATIGPSQAGIEKVIFPSPSRSTRAESTIMLPRRNGWGLGAGIALLLGPLLLLLTHLEPDAPKVMRYLLADYLRVAHQKYLPVAS